MLGKKLTIIGGSGGMGKIFGKFFKSHGFEITLYARNEDRLKKTAADLDVNFELDLKKSVKDADIIMVSIPIQSTPKMIKTIAPFLKENSLIFDICSLKSETYKVLYEVHEKYPLNCLSIHPMFGPAIKDMKSYVLLVLKVGGTEQYDEMLCEFLRIFENSGLIITETAPKVHDLKIALTLGVPHMFNILFLNLLKRSNESLSELTKYTGTTFLLQKIFAESIIQRDMEMFADIQIENNEFYKILDLLEDLIKDYKNVIKNKDKKGFYDFFSEGLEYSKEDYHFNDSYGYFYEFMRILKKN
ncbi:MAG: prephenate dehydrogenase/arogenate dehydrogenase family protein [Candidatus Hodarchaeota archaeon]